MSKLLIFLTLILWSLPAFSHDGLVDRKGCHTDNDGTNFHCHASRAVDPIQERIDSPYSRAPKVSPTDRRISPLAFHRQRSALILDDARRKDAAIGSFWATYASLVLVGPVSGIASNSAELAVASPLIAMIPATTTGLAFYTEVPVLKGAAITNNVLTAVGIILAAVVISETNSPGRNGYRY